MDCELVYYEAHLEGKIAMRNCQPDPIAVCWTHEGVEKREVIDGGVCGFAWVKIRPARGKFVNWLKKQDIGRTSCNGGYDIWCGNQTGYTGQSMAIKEAYARGFAKVLQSYGIKAHAQSRMD